MSKRFVMFSDIIYQMYNLFLRPAQIHSQHSHTKVYSLAIYRNLWYFSWGLLVELSARPCAWFARFIASFVCVFESENAFINEFVRKFFALRLRNVEHDSLCQFGWWAHKNIKVTPLKHTHIESHSNIINVRSQLNWLAACCAAIR